MLLDTFLLRTSREWVELVAVDTLLLLDHVLLHILVILMVFHCQLCFRFVQWQHFERCHQDRRER
jgi:hypothetical protein